jgi:hypothetical protein
MQFECLYGGAEAAAIDGIPRGRVAAFHPSGSDPEATPSATPQFAQGDPGPSIRYPEASDVSFDPSRTSERMKAVSPVTVCPADHVTSVYVPGNDLAFAVGEEDAQRMRRRQPLGVSPVSFLKAAAKAVCEE